MNTGLEYWDIVSKQEQFQVRKSSRISDFADPIWYSDLIKSAIEEETLPPKESPLANYFGSSETYDISYSDEDRKNSFLKYYLPNIFSAIDNSKYLLDLGEDWDDDGAAAADLATYNRAINFVRNYSIKIFQAQPNITISAPVIELLRDGSIAAGWETSTASFTIIFSKSDEKISYCYGKNKVNGIHFKTGIEIDNSVDESVASWMKKNLRM